MVGSQMCVSHAICPAYNDISDYMGGTKARIVSEVQH